MRKFPIFPSGIIDAGKETTTEKILKTLGERKENVNPGIGDKLGTAEAPWWYTGTEEVKKEDILTAPVTFALLKPDAFEASNHPDIPAGMNAGTEIIRRLQRQGFILTKCTAVMVPKKETVEAHLADLKAKNPVVYERNVKFYMGGPLLLMRIARNDDQDPVTTLRHYVGATNPAEANKGTLRTLSDDSLEKASAEERAIRNLIHAADSAESAQRELDIWFSIPDAPEKEEDISKLEEGFELTPDPRDRPPVPPVYQLFDGFGYDTYEYECACACTPNGCMGHPTNTPISICFHEASFDVAGYYAGDFPNKEDTPYVSEIVEKLETAGGIFKPALDLLKDMLCDQETLRPEIRNEALCERAREILKKAEYPI
jgi:nucleoside-diphosphate kinase